MEETKSIVETLTANKYYLMTGDDGNEVYDKDGNLLLYQDEGGKCLSVPNTVEVRKLYDLPLDSPENKQIINIEDIYKPGNFLRIPSQTTNQIVWSGGQKTEHGINATKKLIELFDSPKYQALLKNPNTVKLKVWEKIARELEVNGFKIANTSREAGLKTFQKWRNMERTYWKYMKGVNLENPEEYVEEYRRKKPSFFDELHAIISKRNKESVTETNSVNGNDVGNLKPEEFDYNDEDADSNYKCDSEPDKSKKSSDLNGTDSEPFSRQALVMLTSLVTSPKYDKSLKDKQSNKAKVWESIYMDMMKEGWRFGSTVKEGSLILSEKWRMVEKTILSKKISKPRTLYTATLRKAIIAEIEKRKTLDPISNPPSPEAICSRRRKGEIEPDAIKALLKLLGSNHYQNLFTMSGGKRSNKICEKLFDEVVAQGFEITGASKRDKIERLFQKYRNIKRSFVKYQIAKFKGRRVKKPIFYESMFNIVSKEVLSTNNSEYDSDDERMEESDEDYESENAMDCLELLEMDHDYGNSGDATRSVKNQAVQLQLPGDVHVEQSQSDDGSGSAIHSRSRQPPRSQPVSSRSSRSYEILSQIKSLHETSLAMQQQNFTKIISLLENQIREQNRLTTVISEYIMSQTNKSKSKNGHRTEQFTS